MLDSDSHDRCQPALLDNFYASGPGKGLFQLPAFSRATCKKCVPSFAQILLCLSCSNAKQPAYFDRQASAAETSGPSVDACPICLALWKEHLRQQQIT
jgi:hypothetical protein